MSLINDLQVEELIMNKICVVAGARPNFMKVAPIIKELDSISSIRTLVVHTGQHYDKNMSDLFFQDLEIRRPDIFMGVGSCSHAVQTAEIMKSFEKILLDEKPAMVVVVGDVNSTIACALVASKIQYPHNRCRPLVAHVEAGLRSFDLNMPEEVNRILTDHLSDYLFITEESARRNLLREGIKESKIYFAGNVMIDTLLRNRDKASRSDILVKLKIDERHSVNDESSQKQYAVLTLHRPSNVDNVETLKEIIEAVMEIAAQIPIIFPIHPRTEKHLKSLVLNDHLNFINDNYQPPMKENIINCISPLGYLDFLHLVSKSKLVLTDSGGIQEETTILQVPCITLRENTERPITVTHGTNKVVGTQKDNIVKASLQALNDKNRKNNIPPLWDGKAAHRIIEVLLKALPQ